VAVEIDALEVAHADTTHQLRATNSAYERINCAGLFRLICGISAGQLERVVPGVAPLDPKLV